MEKLEKDYDAVLFAIGAMSGRSPPGIGSERPLIAPMANNTAS